MNKVKAQKIRNKFPAVNDEWCFETEDELREEFILSPEYEDDYYLSLYDFSCDKKNDDYDKTHYDLCEFDF